MKDFEKTIAFVRDFNSFGDLIYNLWHGFYRGSEGADCIIGKMRNCCKETNVKGEELANEIKNVCPDILQIQKYFDIWCSLLDQLDTFPLYDENFSDEEQWAIKLGDDKGYIVVALIKKMILNYNDVMDGKRWLENTYNLNSTEKEEREIYFKELREDFKKSHKEEFNQGESKAGSSFRNIVQSENVDNVLERLHKLIDGKRGKDVGMVILKCLDNRNGAPILMREPTKKELENEFNIDGSTEGVYKYYHNYLDNGYDTKYEDDYINIEI